VTHLALISLQSNFSDFGAPILASITQGDISSADRQAASAQSAFDRAVASLHTRFGDRSLFAGAAVDANATATSETILNEVRALIVAETDPLDVITIVDDYFNGPGGFDATGYLGSANDAPNVELAEGDRLAYAVRADQSEIKDVLSALALTVIGSEGGWPGASDTANLILYNEASRRSIAAETGIVEVRANLGTAEQRIEEASVANTAEGLFLSAALNRIIQRDPFEAAAEFTAIETQLQAVFSITARLSSLTLTNFLR